MGNYNSLYEDYYNVAKKKNFIKNRRGGPNTKTEHKTNFIVRRIMQDLIGILILFAVVLSCKAVVTDQTKAVYTYSKSVINTFYDYKPLYGSIKNLQVANIKTSIVNYYNQIKSKLN